MRNKEKVEVGLVNFERNPLVVIVCVLISGLLAYQTYQFFKVISPWGFVMIAPTAIISFQTLWLLLNPFAIIYEDRLEIKPSFFQHKDCYFIDIKHIAINKKGKVYLTYHDNEIERLNLFGIRAAHVPQLKEEVEKMVAKHPVQA